MCSDLPEMLLLLLVLGLTVLEAWDQLADGAVGGVICNTPRRACRLL
jgi:hypothetical protein